MAKSGGKAGRRSASSPSGHRGLSTPSLHTSHLQSNVTEADLARLTDLIYDAALDPELWPGVLTSLSDALGGSVSSNLFIYDQQQSMAVKFMTSARIDPACIPPYIDYYHLTDIWAQALVRMPVGNVANNQDLFAPGIFESSEWYNDFLAAIDLYHICSSCHPMESGLPSVLSFYRPPSDPDFNDDEKRLYGLIAPHVYRALQLALRLETISGKADTFLGALDTLIYGVVLLDAKGRVVELNHAAESLLIPENGLEVRSGRLEARESAVNTALQALVSEALATSEGEGFSSGGMLPVRRFNSPRPLLLLLAPLPQRRANRKAGFSVDCPGAIVMIKDPDLAPPTKPEVLCALYDLTPAEARLAEALVAGERLNDIAERFGITKETARYQLKAIFSKTGTHSQADLVRLVLSGAAGILQK